MGWDPSSPKERRGSFFLSHFFIRTETKWNGRVLSLKQIHNLARILGIDFGLKRCGVAVTDPLQIIVNGLATVERKELDIFITGYCRDNPVERIVIGYPSQQEDASTSISSHIRAFKLILESLLPGIPVELFEERMSSLKAAQVLVQSGVKKKHRMDKSLIDKISAVIILQRYLGHI